MGDVNVYLLRISLKKNSFSFETKKKKILAKLSLARQRRRKLKYKVTNQFRKIKNVFRVYFKFAYLEAANQYAILKLEKINCLTGQSNFELCTIMHK